MKHRLFFLLAMAVTGALLIPVLSACGSGGGSGTNSSETKEVSIGVLAPLTGNNAADGEDMLAGVKMAAEELNAKGGVAGYKINVVSSDVGNATPDLVVSAINDLANTKKVDAVMAGYVSPTAFEIKNLAQINMPYFLGGYSAQMYAIMGKNADKFPTIFNLCPSFDAYHAGLPVLIQDLITQGKLKVINNKVAIVTSDNPYSKTIADGLVDVFKNMGWTISMNETVPFGKVLDWTAILSKIQQDPPGIVINTDYLPDNDATFMNQFMDDPTNSLMFIQYGPSVPEFVKLTKQHSTGVLYDMLGGPIISPKNPSYTDWLKRWSATHSTEPGPYAEILWQEVMVYADALQKVGKPDDHLAISKAISEVKRDGPAGSIAFDPETHLAMQGDDFIPLVLYQIWDGDRVLLSPDAYSTGSFQTPPWMKP